jgi:NADH-quinone oxidoreductase subunit E
MWTAEEKRVLSDDVIERINKEVARYPKPRAACVEAMKIVQQEHGWVSDTHLAEVAGLLGMSVEELDSIATFYNLIFRRSVGRHVILACDSVSCWLNGSERLQRALTEHTGAELGQTSEDGRFTLLPMVCLGACEGAPAIMVDDDLHTNISEEGLEALLDRYR